MIILLFIPLLLQGLCIFADEFIFHHRRGLPKWEVWGHPLDTLSVVVPFGLIAFNPYNLNLLYVYIALCAFSCLLITKDEFIHTEICSAAEHWLHAVLFVLHPISFLAAAIIWMRFSHSSILVAQFFLVSGFLAYQVLYWGKPWLLLRKNDQ